MRITKGAFGTPWDVGIHSFIRINHETINKRLAEFYLKNPIVKQLYEMSTTQNESFDQFVEIFSTVAFSQVLTALPSKGDVTIRGLDRRDKDSFYIAKNLKPEALSDVVFLMRMLMNRDFWAVNEEFSVYADHLYARYVDEGTIFRNLFNKF